MNEVFFSGILLITPFVLGSGGCFDACSEAGRAAWVAFT